MIDSCLSGSATGVSDMIYCNYFFNLNLYSAFILCGTKAVMQSCIVWYVLHLFGGYYNCSGKPCHFRGLLCALGGGSGKRRPSQAAAAVGWLVTRRHSAHCTLKSTSN